MAPPATTVQGNAGQRAHLFSVTQSQLLKDFVERVFEGSTQQLVLQALGSKKASPEELAEIRALLNEIEGNES